ncbi:CGNR zinc finger domain-containing protein [Spirillospora sp. CA-294931]|uniref:CGNR zinc finger domain-containing protein n=1 Tax=Spirillospora sp. CA-294931 TaxID=3240042 RepID=UPI003D91068F
MIDRPLTGEPLALDLVNTRWPDGGHVHDLFDDPAAFAEWLAGHGLDVPPGTGYREPLLRTRAALRDYLDTGAADGVNAVLEHGRVLLTVTGERVELDDENWRPAWEVARALVDLLGGAPPDRVRRCAGDACVLWFLDTSRNGRRRWCSMTGCGNRAKARAHYAREKNSGESP